MLVTISGIAVIIWGTANSLATLMQARKVARTHSAHDVSLTFIEIRTISFLASCNLGVVTGNIFLIIPGIAGIIASAVTIAIARHYERTTA